MCICATECTKQSTNDASVVVKSNASALSTLQQQMLEVVNVFDVIITTYLQLLIATKLGKQPPFYQSGATKDLRAESKAKWTGK